MNVYLVHFTYVRAIGTRWNRKPGSLSVRAESAAEARVAFEATHPAGSDFYYFINEVETIAAGELF